MSELKIRDISLYSFIVLIVGLLLTSTVLFISLNKIKLLNEQLSVISKAKNSFLEAKINSENLLITKDLAETIKVWSTSIENFDRDFKSLSPLQKKRFDNLWYVSKKEIKEIITILNNKILEPHNLHQKSLLMLKGEMFALKDRNEMFLVIDSLTKKMEFLFQYERFILEEFKQIDQKDKAYISKQITLTTYYSILFIVFILFLTIVVIYFMNKKVLRIEHKLVMTQKSLSESILEFKNSRILLQNIIDSVPASVFWKDKNNVYLGANKCFLNDAGLERKEEILGKTDRDMPWAKSEASKYIADDESVMNSGIEKLQIEETQTNAEGSVIKVLTSKVPLKNTKDEIIGILGIYIDITEKEKIAEELFQKDKLLAQQSKMASMGEMIENIAHQWRQPLSFILTSATGVRLKSDYECLDSKFLQESLLGIEKSVKHLNKTIDDFRNYFKPDKEAKYFDIKLVVDNAFSLVESKLKNKLINVVKEIDEIKAFGFENEFIQVLLNIINNAIDELEKLNSDDKLIFVKAKEIEICGEEVSLEVSKCRCIELKICDSAGGISKYIIDKVFDAHFTTKAEDKGTGIGLYMSSEMIKKHMKGSITVSNKVFTYNEKEHKGAEFTILIPAEDYILEIEKEFDK
ncbi:PAS domain-containing sensor histidine kinase [Arcobacter sp. KX21116]|jgi:PAS domain S-box-containing protein|uniref:PAS domain-containing sensor histidine kinase n=1 Tax=Arcobacter iocasae TaxID=2906515 RepID=UPI0035D453BC